MTYRINYQRKNYLSDYKKFLFYNRKKDFKTIGICAGIVLVLLIIKLLYTENLYLEMAIHGVGFFGLAMFSIYLYSIFYGSYHIKKSAKKLKEGFETITFKSTSIEVSHQLKSYPVFLSQVKECIIIKDTLFVVFGSEKEWPIRINKSEMDEVGFNQVIKEFEKRQIKVKNVV